MDDEPLLRAMMPEDSERIMQDAREREMAKRRRTCKHESTNYTLDDCNCSICGSCEQRIYACLIHMGRQANDARDIARPRD